MGTSAASRSMKGAQRKRLRFKHWVARIWLWCKWATAAGALAALVWGGHAAFMWARQADYFTAQTIEITGLVTLSRQDILYYLAIPAGATLFELDLARIGLRLERHPRIAQVAVKRQLPDTLRIVVQERTPRLVVAAGDQRVVVDGEGVVLRPFEAQDGELPQLMLTAPKALAAGMRLRLPSVQRALEVAQAYAASPVSALLRLASCTVDEAGAAQCRVEPDAFALRIGEGDVVSQLKRLPPVLRYLRQHEVAARTVDVSYRNRVVMMPES